MIGFCRRDGSDFGGSGICDVIEAAAWICLFDDRADVTGDVGSGGGGGGWGLEVIE